jgi:hypothetical protein
MYTPKNCFPLKQSNAIPCVSCICIHRRCTDTPYVVRHQRYFHGFTNANLLSRSFIQTCLVVKKFQDFPSHRTLQHMHGVLNLDENKN